MPASRRRRPARVPASIAYVESLAIPRMMKQVPSSAIWRAIGPRTGLTNWGRKARKKIAVFGLRTLTTIPWRYRRGGLQGGAGVSSGAVRARGVGADAGGRIGYATPE